MAATSITAFILIGVAGYFSTKSVTNEIELTSKRVIRSARLLSETENRFLLIRINGLYHLAYSDPASKAKHDKNIRQLTAEIETYLAEYEKIAADEQDRALLQEDRKLYATYLQALNHMLEHSRANDLSGAHVIVDAEWKPAGNRLTEAFARHREYDEGLVSIVADRAVTSGFDTAILIVIITIIGTLLLGSIQRRQMALALRKHESKLQQLAYHDALTGLPNQILLTDRLRQGIAHAERTEDALAVAYLDLDNFKPLNDSYGHEVGNQILIEFAQRMSGAVRAGDTVARIGGDEFVILLMGQSDAYETSKTLQRFMQRICEPMHIQGHSFSLTASVGISMYPTDQANPDMLLRNADQAMCIAKRSGRNQLVFYGQAQKPARYEGGLNAHDLREALAQGHITVYYQPIIDLESGQVLKAEALARWEHPERGLISPADFIPMAEETGLINDIGDRVFNLTLQTVQEWNQCCAELEAAPISRSISVNRSPRQFLTGNSLDQWLDSMQKNHIRGDMLAIEITEGLLLDDRAEVMEQLNRIRSHGISLSLDDFGTGYSALSYLKKFNIDSLKIDRSFVLDIASDEDDRAIVESIIVMAKHLGIETIAEGVETQAQADLLIAAGCDMVQGYFYARPMPAPQFMDFIRTWSVPKNAGQK